MSEDKCFALYCALYELLEKDNCENVASMIEQLTGMKFANECEWLKIYRKEQRNERIPKN